MNYLGKWISSLREQLDLAETEIADHPADGERIHGQLVTALRDALHQLTTAETPPPPQG